MIITVGMGLIAAGLAYRIYSIEEKSLEKDFKFTLEKERNARLINKIDSLKADEIHYIDEVAKFKAAAAEWEKETMGLLKCEVLLRERVKNLQEDNKTITYDLAHDINELIDYRDDLSSTLTALCEGTRELRRDFIKTGRYRLGIK
ncbi:MAG: hypothetical protein ACRC0G_00305, partial [Fusobacteriaceae bacterium]